MANKKNIYRMDIWLCDFKNNYKSVINGKHPAIIISQWRTNIRTGGSVNIIPLTSNLVKYVDTHIDLKGYNLHNESKAMCNQILTIDKADVLSFIGKITNISDQIEIENAIEKQLQLKQNNFDALDLENLFIENNSTIKKEKIKLDVLKSELYASYCSKQFKQTIILAYQLKELAMKSKTHEKNEFIWYSLHVSSISNRALGNKELALQEVQNCLGYISNPSKFSHSYSISIWNLGNIYEDMGEIGKAFQIYNSLSRFYKNEGETILRLQSSYNVACMKSNHKAMRNIYKILKTVNVTDTTVHNCEKYKQEIIKGMSSDLDSFGIQH